MPRRLFLGLALAVCFGSGCSRDVGFRCEDQERYLGSEEIPPLQVPDDLDPPEESQALRIPRRPESEAAQRPDHGPCTESPPDYFEEGAPG